MPIELRKNHPGEPEVVSFGWQIVFVKLIDDEMFVPHTIHHRFTFFFLCEVVSFIPFFLLLHNQW